MKLELQLDSTCAYIKVSDRPIWTTRKINDNIVIDEDEKGAIVGIELINVIDGSEELRIETVRPPTQTIQAHIVEDQWLNRELNKVRREIDSWPEWLRREAGMVPRK